MPGRSCSTRTPGSRWDVSRYPSDGLESSMPVIGSPGQRPSSTMGSHGEPSWPFAAVGSLRMSIRPRAPPGRIPLGRRRVHQPPAVHKVRPAGTSRCLGCRVARAGWPDTGHLHPQSRLDDPAQWHGGYSRHRSRARLSGAGASVISRSDVVNGVARFAGDDANSGGAGLESRAVEEALSNQASALRLAQLLGADGIIVVTLTRYNEDTRTFEASELGVESTKVSTYDLGAAYQMLSGDNGASVFGGAVDAQRKLKETADLTQRTNPIDGLLDAASVKLCSEITMNSASMDSVVSSSASSRSAVKLELIASGLEVPDIIVNGDGETMVGSTRLPLSPVGARIYVDGVLAGAAPSTLSLSRGVHRLRIDHPLFSSLEEIVNVRGGDDVQTFTFAMVLSPEGRQEWERNVEVLESLKNGEVLREATLIRVRAFAEFLRNSRVDIDTSEVRNLNLGGRTFWGQVLGEVNTLNRSNNSLVFLLVGFTLFSVSCQSGVPQFSSISRHARTTG